jgi:ribosomal protein L11 methyltransferase
LPGIEAGLSSLAVAVSSGVADAEGLVHVEAYCEREPDRAAVTALLAAAALAAGIEMPNFEIARLPDLDWVAESHKALPAIHAGPFYVYGGHVHAAPPAGAIALRIEASAAFGTGHHETTHGCLLALADLRETRAVRRVLDMGCGTGILALAATKLWHCQVVAVDNDPEAVRLTHENAAINGVGDWVRAHLGEGYACPAVGAQGPYDLIVANILAGPLIDLAGDLKRALAPGGVAILSGLLAEQAESVLDAHRSLALLRRYPRNEWVTLMIGDGTGPKPQRP